MSPKKPTFRKGSLFFHKDTHDKVMFGTWMDGDSAVQCLRLKDKSFITVPIDDFLANYVSYAAIEKAAKDKRRGQGW
ncbi:MAG: hypothetical protein AB7F28_03635 [Candidatus Margulisiibacteriota bacterium]